MIELIIFYLIGVILAITSMSLLFYKYGKFHKENFHNIVVLSFLFSYITFFASLGMFAILYVDNHEKR